MCFLPPSFEFAAPALTVTTSLTIVKIKKNTNFELRAAGNTRRSTRKHTHTHTSSNAVFEKNGDGLLIEFPGTDGKFVEKSSKKGDRFEDRRRIFFLFWFVEIVSYL